MSGGSKPGGLIQRLKELVLLADFDPDDVSSMDKGQRLCEIEGELEQIIPVVFELLKAAEDLTDPIRCSYDQQDRCTEHQLHTRPCPHERSRTLLAKHGLVSLSDKLSHWTDDPDYLVADWQHEVAEGDTRQSYQEWVASQKEWVAAESCYCCDDGSGIRARVENGKGIAPPQGFVIVERCGTCKKYESDLEAAEAWGVDAHWQVDDSGRPQAIARPREQRA